MLLPPEIGGVGEVDEQSQQLLPIWELAELEVTTDEVELMAKLKIRDISSSLTGPGTFSALYGNTGSPMVLKPVAKLF